MRLSRVLTVLATLVAVPVTSTAQSPAGVGRASTDTAAAVRPGDLVRLRIWREPDLSGEFPVDETGVVVLPKLGPLKVTTDSPQSLKARLAGAYQRFLSHNSVDVTLLRRVQVLGAVRNPGLYPADPTMTIGDILALAGGTTADGHTDRLELIRHGVKLPGRLSRRTLIGDSPVRSGDQIYVPERSWLSRNPIAVGATVSAVLGLVVARARIR